MANKDSVVFYQSQIDICKRHMTPEQFGRLMFALFAIDNGEDPDVDEDIIIAFEFMALQKSIDRKKYEEICARNRENAKKGGAPLGNQNARKTTENNPKQPTAKKNNPNDKIREDNDKIMIREDKIRQESVPDEISSLPDRVISYLNETCETSYAVSPNSIKLIQGLSEQGYTETDMRKVIDKKRAEWWDDPEMRAYLRPATIFGVKFDEYLGSPEPIQAEEQRANEDQIARLTSEINRNRDELTRIQDEIDLNVSDPDRTRQLIDQSEYLANRIKQFTKRLEAM